MGWDSGDIFYCHLPATVPSLGRGRGTDRLLPLVYAGRRRQEAAVARCRTQFRCEVHICAARQLMNICFRGERSGDRYDAAGERRPVKPGPAHTGAAASEWTLNFSMVANLRASSGPRTR